MAKHTVKIKKYLDVIEEYVAASAITPGHMVEITSAGKVKPHATAGGNAVPMFALEDELQGNGITDAYAADDPVQVWVAQRGEQVYAIIAHGQTIAIGDPLESAGDGTLKKHTPDDADSSARDILGNQIVAYALEACSVASSGLYDDDDPRCVVMVA